MLPPFFSLIGADRCVTSAEAARAAGLGHDGDDLRAAWSLYQEQFGGICESTIDPQFHALAHPARWLGALVIPADEPVLVVGNGPSARAAMPDLKRVRSRVRLFTSPRGATLLTEHGLQPDLILVEHRTALDAHHSAQLLADGGPDPLRGAPLVAAEWRTPASLLAGVPSDRLFVPDPCPTWGWWPATLTALAVEAGATRVGLLGIDLGTTERPDQAFEPLALLLTLIARLGGVETFDCGRLGSPKAGWPAASIESCAGDICAGPLRWDRRTAPPSDARLDALTFRAHALAPLVQRARQMLAVALDVRGGAPARGLEALVAEMLAWGHDSALRFDVQDGLGASCLPRLWRTGVDPSLGRQLWRPLVLGLHELSSQAARLDALVERVAA